MASSTIALSLDIDLDVSVSMRTDVARNGRENSTAAQDTLR